MKSAVDSSVVHQVRLGDGVSRVELARRLRIAPSTIGVHVDRLLRGGFLREGKRAETASGRPPTILELNPAAGQFIGVDMDAHQIRAISVDFAQQTLAEHVQRIRPRSKAKDVVEQIAATIESVRCRTRRLLGIGLALPGTVDIETGTAKHYKFIRGWQNLPIGRWMKDRFAVPIYIENNIRSMALAERWFGLGRDINDYLCIGIRSGIGSGLFVNGELYRGSGGIAGEIGCWPCIDADSGATRTLEEIAAIPALLEKASKLANSGSPTSIVMKRNKVSLDSLLSAIAENDPLARQVVGAAAEDLGRVIAQVHLLINPQRVIIAGPLAGLEEAFLMPLRHSVARCLPTHDSSIPDIAASKLDHFVAALGAAACAVHAWQPETPVEQSSPLAS